jgi:putative nucleotidyltransferase with HDIG domain
MTREEALQLVRQHVKNENSVKHMLATEAIMRALARRFGEDEEIWGLSGLVHDIDMEMVNYREHPEKHGKVGAAILEKAGFAPVVIEAVKAHNPATGKIRGTRLEKAIYCVDPLTGLIVASALVLPGKKLADLKAESVLKRFKEKHFAQGANREKIVACSEIDLSLEEFIKVGLEAMQGISDDLGL